MKNNELTMQATYVSGYGSSDYIQVREIARPTLKPNQIIIKNHVSTVTRADTMMLSGKPYFARLMVGLTKPKHPVPGTGFSGVVHAIGEGVTNVQIGDKVFGETTLDFGANAEYLSIDANGVVIAKPDFLTDDVAATLGDGPVTSYNFLKLIGNIQPGQHVLINGASGALGTAAVQLAKYFGATVTGVCSTRNVALIEKLGADFVIDYTKKSFEDNVNHYDIIFDTVGKSSYKKAKSSLRKNGQYLSPVLKGGLLMQSIWTNLFGDKKAKFAATGMKKDHEIMAIFVALIKIYQSQNIETVIDKKYDLADVAAAHDYVGKGKKVGNVLLKIN